MRICDIGKCTIRAVTTLTLNAWSGLDDALRLDLCAQHARAFRDLLEHCASQARVLMFATHEAARLAEDAHLIEAKK